MQKSGARCVPLLDLRRANARSDGGKSLGRPAANREFRNRRVLNGYVKRCEMLAVQRMIGLLHDREAARGIHEYVCGEEGLPSGWASRKFGELSHDDAAHTVSRIPAADRSPFSILCNIWLNCVRRFLFR